MKNKLFQVFIFFFLFYSEVNAQNALNESQEKMTKSINGYFSLDRENIHLHLNKNTYLTYEDIWFKGYIVEKKSLKPYTKTSNVFVTLFDENGNKLKNSLYYAENSTFSGNLKLDEKYKTGVYYLQVYTNYMNNFIENESSVYKIYLINPSEKNSIDAKKINYNAVSMDFFPESGTFLEGTSNAIAVKIADCNDNAIAVTNAEIFDSKGKLVTNFSTNEFGFGRFEIKSTNNEIYKAVVTINNKKVEKALPKPTSKGITFSVNNYTLPNKLSINVKTNAATLNEIKENTYTLVFQKNDIPLFLELSFKNGNPEQSFILGNDLLLSGINTISLVDKNFAKIGERNIYIASQNKNTLDIALLKKEKDSISISGFSNIPFSEMSISVLPNGNTSDALEKSILNSFEFDNGLENSVKNASYYITDINRKKQIELDNVLISQKSKYNWLNLMAPAPTEKFDFDMGVAIKGTVINPVSNQNEHKIKMNSLILGINEFANLNEQSEFYFDNFIAQEATMLNFTMLNSKGDVPNTKMSFQLLKNNRDFLKPLEIKPNNLCVIKEASSITLPLLEGPNAKKLDDVNISSKVKKEGAVSNTHSKESEITDADVDTYVDVLRYIQGNGYDVSVSGSSVTIRARVPSTFKGSRSPQVFIDGAPETDFNRLNNMSLRDIKEITINKKGFGGGDNSSNGIIRIFTKRGETGSGSNLKSNAQTFTIKNGFMPTDSFKNPYSDYKSEGFKKYGTIHWIPKVFTDETGSFKFSIPNFGQESVKIIIEGISSDGRLISEIRTLQIP